MEGKMIPLSVPNLRGNECKYVMNAVKTEWVSTGGPYIGEFETKVSDYVKVKGAVACQNGTAGLHISLLLMGVEKGDAVLVPTLTFIAAVNPIRYLGAEPIFMDCDDSLCIDPVKLEEFCKTECELVDGELREKVSGRRIRALVVVHVFGNMADMESILNIASKFHLKVVEDATEAMGTRYTEGKYEGRFAGTLGAIGVFSFNGNKIITTGGGGMIVSNHETYLKRARHLTTQAKQEEKYFIHDEVGYNYRMTNLQAALGLAQLEQLESFIKVKKQNYCRYRDNGLCLLNFRKGIKSNHWFYSFVTKSRDALIQYLDENQIQSRPIWKLIHTLKPYENCRAYRIEKASDFYKKIINIPCSTNLTVEEVDRVSAIILNFQMEL